MAFMFRIRDMVKPRANVLRDAGIQPGFSVLDFGCGPGGYIIPLAGLVGDTGKIYALDVNPLAINYVKSITGKKKLSNVDTILSDGDTGLPDASLDIILLYDVFHHLDESDNILKEFHRVLKNNGTLSVTDHHLEKEKIISGITGSHLFRLDKKGEIVLNFSRI